MHRISRVAGERGRLWSVGVFASLARFYITIQPVPAARRDVSHSKYSNIIPINSLMKTVIKPD